MVHVCTDSKSEPTNVVKALDTDELLARIRAVSRRVPAEQRLASFARESVCMVDKLNALRHGGQLWQRYGSSPKSGPEDHCDVRRRRADPAVDDHGGAGRLGTAGGEPRPGGHRTRRRPDPGHRAGRRLRRLYVGIDRDTEGRGRRAPQRAELSALDHTCIFRRRGARSAGVASVCFDASVWKIFAPLVRGGTVLLADNLLACSPRQPGRSSPCC